MKIRLWFFLAVVGVLLMLLHEEMTNGMTILSDIHNDSNVSDGWPWCIGIAGVISCFFGLALGFVELIQRDNREKLDAQAARAEERRNRTINQLSK